MTRSQLDLFGADQPELFNEEAAPVVYRADPHRIRRRIANMLAEVRGGTPPPLWTKPSANGSPRAAATGPEE